MLDIFLFIHMVIAVLLIVVILMQKTGSDGLSGIGGGNNMGVISHRTAANFLNKMTIVLAAMFMANALLLANLSTRKADDIDKKFEQQIEKAATQDEAAVVPVK